MIVGKHMTANPVVIGPDDLLSTADAKMKIGEFRRLPVVRGETLIGIVTDRDLRQYMGVLEKIKVSAVMTETLTTVSPGDTIERAAQLMLDRRISGLPVIENERLVGIITTSDILKTFLDVMGASDEESARIDLLVGREGADLAQASRILKERGAEILGLGTHRERWGGNPICYLRLRCAHPDDVAKFLQCQGYNVVGVYV